MKIIFIEINRDIFYTVDSSKEITTLYQEMYKAESFSAFEQSEFRDNLLRDGL